MTNVLAPQYAATETNTTGVEIFHMFCCDENVAMCGTDVTGLPRTSGEGEQECVVCVALDALDCAVCGQ